VDGARGSRGLQEDKEEVVDREEVRDGEEVVDRNETSKIE
jgi:hypothetical protein